MDRLIIESILSDLHEIHFAEGGVDENAGSSIVLGFKNANMDQVVHALSALKKIAGEEEVELIICKTVQPGIFDLEIKTDALDEPIRIMNKSISNERLAEIGEKVSSETRMVLSANSPDAERINLGRVKIKECATA